MSAQVKVKFTILFLLMSFLNPHLLLALDYSDMYSTLSDTFAGYVDPNEGLTIFRSLYVPSGGRAEALGTAFSALSDDISFFEYNPAASCILTNTEIAAFHNSWIADSAIETLAFTQRKNNFGYGAAFKCFYLPFTEYNIFGEKVSRGYYSETLVTLNLSYNFLAGYTFKGVATGINFKGGFRNIPDYADNDTNQVIKGSGLAQSGIAGMIDAGLIFRFNFGKLYSSREPNLNIGLSAHNIGMGFTGFGQKIQKDDALPSYGAIGLSYRMFRPIVFTLEFQKPFNLLDLSESEQFAIAMGVSVQTTDFFAFQGGFLLRGGNPRFTLGGEFTIQTITCNVNYTLDLSSSTNPINKISMSAKVNLGDRGRNKEQETVDNLYTDGLYLYSEGHMVEAISVWNEALIIFPRFDPAIKGIKAAQDVLDLQQKIKEIQTLD
jgi:hypothetical protein